MATPLVTVLISSGSEYVRRRLVSLVQASGCALAVQSCGSAGDVERACAVTPPDVLFLDLQLPGMEPSRAIRITRGTQRAAIVCMTRFDQHTVRSLDRHRVNFLITPVSTKRLRRALARATASLAGIPREQASLLAALMEMDVAGGSPDAWRIRDRIMVRTPDGVEAIRTRDVDWLETSGNHLSIQVCGTSHLVRITVARIEACLDRRAFVRIHRRVIVNLDRVVGVERAYSGDATVQLLGGAELRASRTHYWRFVARLNERRMRPADQGAVVLARNTIEVPARTRTGVEPRVSVVPAPP